MPQTHKNKKRRKSPLFLNNKANKNQKPRFLILIILIFQNSKWKLQSNLRAEFWLQNEPAQICIVRQIGDAAVYIFGIDYDFITAFIGGGEADFV